MQRGILGVAYAMNAYSEKLNITSNNIANLQTTGFKKQNASFISFDSYMVREISNNSRKLRGNLGTVSLANGLSDPYTDFEQGIVRETGNRNDFAINGDGFFVIESPINWMINTIIKINSVANKVTSFWLRENPSK